MDVGTLKGGVSQGRLKFSGPMLGVGLCPEFLLLPLQLLFSHPNWPGLPWSIPGASEAVLHFFPASLFIGDVSLRLL